MSTNKIFLIAGAAVMLASCGGKSKTDLPQHAGEETPVVQIVSSSSEGSVSAALSIFSEVSSSEDKNTSSTKSGTQISNEDKGEWGPIS